jgi:hypothetical protein
MKYLKYTFIVLASLFVVFFALGLLKPTIHYECETVVEKNAVESWSVLQDPEKLGEWLPGFIKMEHISGDPGAVGAISEVYFDENGQQMVIKETITAVDPGQSMSMLYESDFMNMDYHITLTEIDGKTKISTSTSNQGNGLFSKSILAMMGGSLKQQEEENLANLKKAIESNTKTYPPLVP